MDRANILSGGSFRATFYGAVVFLAVLAISGVLAIGFIENGLRHQMRLQLTAEINAFEAQYEIGGAEELIRAARELTRIYAASHILLLVYDAEGNRRVGQRDVTPDFSGWVTREVAGGATGLARERYYMTAVRLGDLTLVMGRDLQFMRQFEVVTIQAFLVVGAIMTLVLIFLGYWISRAVQHKLDAMGDTLFRVAQGETEVRLAVSPEGDQIDRIAAVMNTHLDSLSRMIRATRSSAAAIAHDLKKPLARACLGLDDVLRDPALSEGQAARLAESRHELARLTAIFETILRIARIDADRHTGADQVFDLRAVIEDLGETFEVVAEESGQRLVVENEAARPLCLRGDPGMIGQLIANLLQNAISHCPPGTFVTLRLTATAGQVVVTVADTGPGIPPADRDRVFEAFYRGDRARTGDGNGLGLALVRSIAERHGATITLEDNRPGLVVRVGFARVAPG